MRNRKPLRHALSLLALPLLLTACGNSSREAPIVTRIERVTIKPPAELLTCARPPMPADEARVNQDALAELVERVGNAWRECFDRLRAVREFVEETSK